MLRLVLPLVCFGATLPTWAAPAPLALTSPQPYQVVQRQGFEPGQTPGYTDVLVQAPNAPGTTEARWEYRVVTLADHKEHPWAPLHIPSPGGALRGYARINAGGWYRLEIRAHAKDTLVAQGVVEPIGVGEVFLVAGQSYATNCNDERFVVQDKAKRVVAYHATKKTWAVANDPQPAPDQSDGGSIWPPLGDALAQELQVPIAFVNVAVGATSSQQWQPKGVLHNRLLDVGQTIERFRAVLWQQGESDVIAKTTTADYVANLKKIRHTAADAWRHEAPWLLAKSTHHPTVYNDPAGEERIRAAIDELARVLGFGAGPDTDTLKGAHRGDAKSRRHFSALGQRKAAELWFAVLKQHLSVRRPIREVVGDLHLLEPVWASKTVHRESAVLLQPSDDGPTTVRLAYPAATLLDIVSPATHERYPLATASLSTDGHTLTFTKPPREPIKTRDFFPPKDAPNSYRQRIDHPDQNLLYRPGRWFHDRNLDISYIRRDPVPEYIVGTLPKTIARLRRGEPVTVGVSGDSISTGLDASLTAKAWPYQPGYAELTATQLDVLYRTPINLKNRAVSGWSIANGVADLDKLLQEKPHILIIAYGMNDVGRRDPAWFGKQAKTMLDRIRLYDPAIEVILVAPMLGHAEWMHTPRAMFNKYRDELQAFTGPGIALADVTRLWEDQLRHKHDLDLTGNGLNHPNDYGHRIYAQAVLSLLKERAK